MNPVPRDYSPRADTLAGRVILVTGASDGIGRAVAEAAARAGARLVLLGRDAGKLERVADGIEAAGGAAPRLHAMDFSAATWNDHLALAHALADEFGRLDGLAHIAGVVGDRAPVLHYDVETWQRVMTVNLTAPFLLTRACLGLLGRSADASVVFTGSGAGRRGRAYWGAYAVSKFGTEGLMEVLADETAENTKIRVNSLDPGAVRTAMRAHAYPGEDPRRLPVPAAVAPAFIWLLGPDSGRITGRSFAAQ